MLLLSKMDYLLKDLPWATAYLDNISYGANTLEELAIEMSYFDITPVWIPRTDSLIQEVDAKGRFDDDSAYGSDTENLSPR